MKLQQLFAEIDARKEKLNEYRPLTQGESERLWDEFIIGFIYNSNAIEGNTMTLDETALVLKEGIAIGEKSVREHIELIGHRDACLFVEELVRDPEPLTEKIILDLHHIVFMDRREDRGLYRRAPVRIAETQTELPQPWQVPMEMERLLEDYHGEVKLLHPVERVALFHLRFRSIHPFIDGNGRMGRLLMNLELMKEGFPSINIKFQDRARYMAGFRAWDTEKRPDPMTELISEYMIAQLDEYLWILEIANGHRQGPERAM